MTAAAVLEQDRSDISVERYNGSALASCVRLSTSGEHEKGEDGGAREYRAARPRPHGYWSSQEIAHQ
jgi:hypothetical protein